MKRLRPSLPFPTPTQMALERTNACRSLPLKVHFYPDISTTILGYNPCPDIIPIGSLER